MSKSSHNDHVSVIKSDIEISHETHGEYIRYHEKVNTGNLDADKVVAESKVLFSNSTGGEDKKRILFSLAHVGTLEAISALQKYLENPDQKLAAWATLCFNECRMFVKEDELDEDQTIIMSGAGGEGNRLRFYVIVSMKRNRRFSQEQEQKVRIAYKAVSSQLKSKFEYIEFGNSHALISTLIPMNVAPAEFIEQGIHACNKDGNFLRFHYYVTNIRKPTEREVAHYLEGCVDEE